LLKRAVELNDVTSLTLTKIDVLDGFKDIRICFSYRYRGKIIKSFPLSIKEWANLKPVYRNVRGWMMSTTNIRSYTKLPLRAKDYIKIIEDYLKVRIELISVGYLRKAVIKR